MIRDLRASDSARVFEFLSHEFPEEEAILGTRIEGFEKIVRRIFRWDSRLLLGLLRLAGRPIFRFFVIEDGGRIVATTLLTFPQSTGYVSMVVVDPSQRRRGLARRLLEEARQATDRRGRPYITLGVLEGNAPARALYESIGYRTLRSSGYLVRETGVTTPDVAPSYPGLRVFRREDAPALAAIAQRNASPEVAKVLPVRAKELIGSGWIGQLMSTETSAWVIDRGQGPEAHLSASRTPATVAGHLSEPIVAESVDPAAVGALVRTGVAWLGARGAPRAVTMVADENRRARAALEEAGFRHALGILTLYRPSR